MPLSSTAYRHCTSSTNTALHKAGISWRRWYKAAGRSWTRLCSVGRPSSRLFHFSSLSCRRGAGGEGYRLVPRSPKISRDRTRTSVAPSSMATRSRQSCPSTDVASLRETAVPDRRAGGATCEKTPGGRSRLSVYGDRHQSLHIELRQGDDLLDSVQKSRQRIGIDATARKAGFRLFA